MFPKFVVKNRKKSNYSLLLVAIFARKNIRNMDKLSARDRDKLIDAIPLITAYVAFADGSLDASEVNTAKRLATLKKHRKDLSQSVRKYFEEVINTFDDRFEKLVGTLPEEEVPRMDVLEKKLCGLNGVLEKLDPLHAYELYKTFKSYASRVAKSEGSFLGMGGVGPKQDKAAQLVMLSDPDSI